MTDGFDGEREAIRLRQAIARLARRLRANDAASGLTPTQGSVLSTVVRHGPVGLSELSRIEGVNPTMLSRAVAALEEAGLVQRQVDARDRRAAIVGPTLLGERLWRRLRAERNDVLHARLAQLDDGERRLLIEALPVLETLAERLRDDVPSVR